MTLTTGQQAALYTIALIFVGIGLFGTADQLKTYGLPPIAGLVIAILALIGTALIKAYGLDQQKQLAKRLAAQIVANKNNQPSNTAPDTTKQ